jgi:hypothetical protein
MPLSKEDIGKKIRRYDDLDAKRSNFVNLWRELAQFYLPWRQWRAGEQVQGSKGTEHIFDSHGCYELLKFANAIHSLLANPGGKMFSLHIPDRALMRRYEVKTWLEECAETLHMLLNNSNFAMEFNQACHDLGLFGTAPLYIEEDPTTVFRFTTFLAFDVVVAESHAGKVDTVFLKRSMTHRQIVDKYGLNAVSDKTRELFERRPDETAFVLQCVEPRPIYDPRKMDSQNMPFASYALEVTGHHLLQESGYLDFPWCVPRLQKQTGEMYGRSNAMLALADTKQLNAMVRSNRKAGQRIGEPPLMVPDDGFMLPIKVNPNALNFYNRQMQARIESMPVSQALPFVVEFEQDKRQAITSAFHGDLLQLPINPNMTATEVVQRYQDQARILGPVGGRMFYELFDPAIDRIFSITLSAGKFPPIPQIIGEWARANPGSKIEVQYDSVLMMGQRLQRAGSFMRALTNTGPLIQAKPDVLDNLDTDKIFCDVCLDSGMPAEWLLDPDLRDRIREAKKQALAEERQKMDAMRMAQGLKQASDAGLIDKEAGGGITPGQIKEGVEGMMPGQGGAEGGMVQ